MEVPATILSTSLTTSATCLFHRRTMHRAITKSTSPIPVRRCGSRTSPICTSVMIPLPITHSSMLRDASELVRGVFLETSAGNGDLIFGGRCHKTAFVKDARGSDAIPQRHDVDSHE